jgi:hypothetical protein
MSYQKTVWKNREVERPRTYNIQENEDGTITLIPAEGAIIEPGTPITAQVMQNIEDGIEVLDNTLKSHLADYASDKADIGQLLWEGESYPSENQTVTPSKTLSQCKTGWILRWQKYTMGVGKDDSNFYYTHIPKIHGNGLGIRLVMPASISAIITKYIYVYNDRIVGASGNDTGGREEKALTGVFEY